MKIKNTLQQLMAELGSNYEILQGEIWMNGHPLMPYYLKDNCTALEKLAIETLNKTKI